MAPSPKKAFPLRIDPALFAAIERTASADLRSANAQIEVLLREALTRRGVKLAAAEPVKRGRPAKTENANSENSDG